ncbi:MAG: nitroreductase family protein [Clostridia bacterium]|nr:nitroreductase family protein [Clostridia bacterium]
MNETITLLNNRKSVRVFEGDMPEADVQAILRAAVEAPTAGNMTLWTAIRVTDENKKQQLAESCDHQPFIAQAPLVLVFCADYRRWMQAFEALQLDEPLRRPGEGDLMLAACDAVIAAQSAVVAAESLGYGSCYIGDILENADTQREILGLPAYVKPICMAVFGKATAQQQQRPKPRRFRVEDVVHENTYRDVGADGMLTMLANHQQLQGQALTDWLTAFCKRKWNCDFSIEMTRSVRQMLEEWNKGI